MSDKYRNVDMTTTRDVVHVNFQREEVEDEHERTLKDFLSGDEEYRTQDEERFKAWQHGEFAYIGIRAVAYITIQRGSYGIRHILRSAGIWGIESDSEESYLQDEYLNQIEELKSDIEALGLLPKEYTTK